MLELVIAESDTPGGMQVRVLPKRIWFCFWRPFPVQASERWQFAVLDW